jgi:ABC-2 type transport system permease protein
VSRSTALTGKLLAGLTNLVIFNLVTLVSSFVFVGYYGKGESVTNEILVLMAGLLFLQLIFFSIGAVVAGTAKKPKSAGTRAMSIMLFTFVLFYLVNLNESLNPLKYLTPFKYFDAAVLMKDGLDPVFVTLSLVIVVLGIAGTYYFYSRRDLSV